LIDRQEKINSTQASALIGEEELVKRNAIYF